MKKRNVVVACGLLAVVFCLTWVNNPAIAQQVGDGAEQELIHVERLRARYDSIHREDSMQRVELMKQMEQLKSSNNSSTHARLLKYIKQGEYEDSVARLREFRILQELQQSGGAPVAPFRDTLFFVYMRIGSFNASQRAAAIQKRIGGLYENRQFEPDSLKLVSGEGSTDIVYRDEIIMSVTEPEASFLGKHVGTLAAEYRTLISQAIARQREVTSFRQIALRIGGVVLILTGVFLIVRLITRLFRRLRRKIIARREHLARGVRIGNYQFLDATRLTQVILFLSNIIRLAIIVIAIYITLPPMFLLFPWTEGIADTLLGWILSPLRLMYRAFVTYLPDLFTIVVIVFITHYVLRFVKFIASEIENGSLVISGFYPDWARPTLNIVRILVMSFSFIVIFPYLPGSDSPIFQGVSVFLGLLLSLGSSSAISNVVAGLVITYMRPFKIGDRVRIGEISGDVMEKTLLVTRIRTVKNEDITVPNSAILSGHTINYTTAASEVGLILHTSVTIGYSVPWKQVHELLIMAARNTASVLSDGGHEPFVLQTSLQDFYIEYQLNAYTKDSHGIMAIYSALHQNIQDAFAAAGVEIMSPHFSSVRDGNPTELPNKQ